MKTRQFDSIAVSEIGLGCWQIGSEWGDVDDAQAESVLRAALDSGVTFFDTADVYGAGRSERRIAPFLAEHRDRMFVATKLGRFPEPGWPDNFRPETIRQHTESSLTRLGVETLDLTQLHCVPAEQMRRGGMFDVLRQLKAEGKIQRFGASVESMDEALLCLDQEPELASLQIIFNIFRQKPIEVLFEKAKTRGVALIVRLPVASGLLAGKFTPESSFPENDHRNYNRDGDRFNVGETFAGLPFETGVALADQIKPHVPPGMTMAQMALRWILDFEAVTTVIPGGKSAAQVAANAAASDLPPLAPELHAWLREFYSSQVAAKIRGPY